MMGGRFCRIGLCLGLLLFPLFLLPAGGSKEDPIAVARNLIIEKRYNEALLVLADVARKDPERMEEAENLIRRIRTIRGEYYNKYEELIDVLYEQKDVEKALSIIRELESLDAAPNEETKVALLKAKESAQFVYNQNRFNDIMTRAAKALEEKNYFQAIELYLSGFDIGKESFLQAKYGNIVESHVFSVLDTLNKTSFSFLQAKGQYDSAVEKMIVALRRGRIEEVRNVLPSFIEVFQTASLLYKTAAETAVALEDQNRKLVLIRPGQREDFFLGFTQRLSGGRSSATSPEGIRGALHLFLQDKVLPVSKEFTAWIAGSYEEGETLYRQGLWEQALAVFQQIQVQHPLARQADQLWYQAMPVFEGRPVPVYWELLQDYIPLWIDQVAKTKGSSSYLSMIEESLSIRRELDPLPSERVGLRDLRSSIQRKREFAYGGRRNWENFVQEYANNPFLLPESLETVKGVTALFTERIAFWEKTEVDIVDRIASLDLIPLEENFDQITAQYRTAEELFTGKEERIRVGEGLEEVLVVKYPNRTVSLLTDLIPKAELLRTNTRNYLATYRSELPAVLKEPRFQEKLGRAEAIRKSLEEILLPGAASLRSKAQENILLAERYRNEGNRRVQEAQAALAQNRFEQARESLGAARQRFSLSLSYQEDPVFRRESDEILLALNTAIADAENRIVVAEVRNLINEAKRLYYINAFDEAESLLMRAQTRWRATQTEDNTEVTYWLGFVRAALFVKSSREILVTDPLYVEMSQLLSLAQKDFETGKALLEKGNRREALDSFTRAEEKIRTVLLAFPFNQQASVLALRIAQLKDRESFATLFRTKFREALAKMDTNPQEAYIDLKDLEAIDPNFAGLKDAIYRAEIQLGIRVLPPDPRAIAESEELYRRAYQIVAGNVRAQFPIALEQLNRAVELNPNNTKAIELKDRIQIDAGGQTAVVLSSVAEEQYRLAEKRFLEGNYFEALAIVQRLLQNNKESRNYPPLLELKRRIESRI
jgi:hypothetical protein